MSFKATTQRFYGAARAGAGAEFRQSIRTPLQRRWQTVAAETAPQQTAMQRLWNSPVGPKTVHFWAPVMKVRGSRHLNIYSTTLSFTI